MRWARWLVLARLASSGSEVARHAHCTALELRVIGVTLVERADGAAHLAVYPHVNVFAPCVDDPAHFDSNETEVCYSVAPVPNRWHTRAEPPHDTCRAMPLTFPVVFELAFRAQLEVLAFLRRRGRWTSEKTLERYLQEGVVAVSSMLQPPRSQLVLQLCDLAPALFT